MNIVRFPYKVSLIFQGYKILIHIINNLLNYFFHYKNAFNLKANYLKYTDLRTSMNVT